MFKIVRTLMTMNLKLPKQFSTLKFPCRLLPKRLCSTANSQNVYLLDEDDNSGSLSDFNSVNKYTQRTYTCGQLTVANVGERVVLCGWLEFQRMNKFVVLRDSYGETQLIAKEANSEVQQLLANTPLESIVRVEGTVLSRPVSMRNKGQKTGEIEVLIENLQVLNSAKAKLPFNIRQFQKAKEALRMQYRYLDLRFPAMQRNLRVRSEMLMKMRDFLVNHAKFVDVETPTLFRRTPGGAQEFVVPTRFPGQFYALVQSPQQFKQMLMAGSIDRYFQIARCYRDEGSRSDRQPEFTQLDLEVSFTDSDGIFSLVEDLLWFSWPKSVDPLPRKFAKLTYREAMENYGSDQPDTRFDCKLRNCTRFMGTEKRGDFGAHYLVFPKEYSNLTKSAKEKNVEISKQYSGAKFVQFKMKSKEDGLSKLGKILGSEVASKMLREIRVEVDDVLFLAFGNRNQTLNLLGKIRVEFADFQESLGIKLRKTGMHPLWIHDFPLFERDAEGNLTSPHHPFTAPNPEDLDLIETAPLQVRALSYDLVLNGNEIGGGSIRIHDPELQELIFDKLRIDKVSLRHILDMLGSGCPPHGGIALGLDRLLSKILKTTSIRDVIAFPKTFEGRDPLSGAPSPISEEEKTLYHIKCTEGK